MQSLPPFTWGVWQGEGHWRHLFLVESLQRGQSQRQSLIFISPSLFCSDAYIVQHHCISIHKLSAARLGWCQPVGAGQQSMCGCVEERVDSALFDSSGCCRNSEQLTKSVFESCLTLFAQPCLTTAAIEIFKYTLSCFTEWTQILQYCFFSLVY